MICACLDLSVSSSSWCLGRAAVCDCGTSWTFLLPFFLSEHLALLSHVLFSYVCSICACLDLSVSSSSWGLGRAAVCDCGTPWTFLLPFFALCYFVLVFFSPLSIAITSQGEEGANLVLFVRLFICACLVLYVSASSSCLGWAAACDCGTPGSFL